MTVSLISRKKRILCTVEQGRAKDLGLIKNPDKDPKLIALGPMVGRLHSESKWPSWKVKVKTKV